MLQLINKMFTIDLNKSNEEYYKLLPINFDIAPLISCREIYVLKFLRKTNNFKKN